MSYRIYVACLAAYNNSWLHGSWIDIEGKNSEEVYAEIQSMLATSPEKDAEEWAIHNHEGFDGLDVTESHDIEALCDYVDAITTSTYPQDLIAGVCDHLHVNAREAIDYIEDKYKGEHTDLETYIIELLEDTGGLENVPMHLRNYFDYAAYARDMELNGDIFTIDSPKGIYVLWNH